MNRDHIGSRSQSIRNGVGNPWDGNTDHVKRDFAGRFVPHSAAKPKKEKYQGFVPHSQAKGRRPNENGDGNRSPNKNKKRRKRNKAQKQPQREKDTDRGIEESKINEEENRMEWMEKMVNMGFEADKAFEAIAQSSNFNEALEHVMQSIV